ncbi:MAG: Fic family protein [Patescibacteria group bacterium]
MTKSSTKPKGATSFKETAFGIIPRNELLRLEIDGTKRGLEFIHKLASSDEEIIITSELIKRIHKIAFGWIFPDWAGEYRVVQVEFSGKEAIHFSKIPEMMENLCEDLKVRIANLNFDDTDYIEKVVELVAWFQHRLVFIHPFQDYNGRIARMLTTLILLILKLPAIEISVSGSGRKKYLEALYTADEGNFSKLEIIISVALNESMKKFN